MALTGDTLFRRGCGAVRMVGIEAARDWQDTCTKAPERTAAARRRRAVLPDTARFAVRQVDWLGVDLDHRLRATTSRRWRRARRTNSSIRDQRAAGAAGITSVSNRINRRGSRPLATWRQNR